VKNDIHLFRTDRQMALFRFPPLSSRRGRTVVVAVIFCVAFLLLGRDLLNPSDLDYFTVSQQNIANYFGSKSRVNEIYGLLHLVTSGNEKHLTDAAHVNPSKPVDFTVYAGGKMIDWEVEVRRLDTIHPIVVFSKSYCPYSQRAKRILTAYDIHPAPFIVEVDLRDDDTIIKTLLTRMTGLSTFPNIIVGGNSIGGSDDLTSLHQSHELESILQRAGAVVSRI
jgi:glutaredoxin